MVQSLDCTPAPGDGAGPGAWRAWHSPRALGAQSLGRPLAWFPRLTLAETSGADSSWLRSQRGQFPGPDGAFLFARRCSRSWSHGVSQNRRTLARFAHVLVGERQASAHPDAGQCEAPAGLCSGIGGRRASGRGGAGGHGAERGREVPSRADLRRERMSRAKPHDFTEVARTLHSPRCERSRFYKLKT